MSDYPERLLIQGDARRVPLADGSVHCVVTSPPYFGLRDYGTSSWTGGDPECDHRESKPSRTANAIATSGLQGSKETCHASHVYRDVCGRCGANRVDRQIGLEPTPDAFVAAMVGVFREVRRVLRDDGVCWLNLGDSYSGSGPSGASYQSETTRRRESGNGTDGAFRVSKSLGSRGLTYAEKKPIPPAGFKPKDRLGIPHRVVFALQADGWYWRDEIIWHKPNPMPESVTDRTTKAHEMVFLLTKSARYFYDNEAVKEDATCSGDSSERIDAGKMEREILGELVRTRPVGRTCGYPEKRNLRSVWTITTRPFDGAHFATMPPELAETCIKAGSPRGGIVFDPFNGAGTTGLVAARLGRRYVGADLSREYLEMAEARIAAGLRPVSKLDAPRPVVPMPGQMSFLGEGA